jgi:hypothetical protein
MPQLCGTVGVIVSGAPPTVRVRYVQSAKQESQTLTLHAIQLTPQSAGSAPGLAPEAPAEPSFVQHHP